MGSVSLSELGVDCYCWLKLVKRDKISNLLMVRLLKTMLDNMTLFQL